MLNGKVYMADTIKEVMGDETKMRLRKDTLARLRDARARGKFTSYDDMMNYFLDNCPITSPAMEGGGK